MKFKKKNITKSTKSLLNLLILITFGQKKFKKIKSKKNQKKTEISKKPTKGMVKCEVISPIR